MKLLDLTDRAFGRLTVISRAANSEVGSKGRWNCVCACGASIVVIGQSLSTGHTTSCGCLRAEVCSERSTTHGMAKTPIYNAWWNMRERCRDPKRKDWKSYGGRGITVCERWKEFPNFLADMGERPSPAHSIDRIDNNGNYEPGNCRWATAWEQRNNMTMNRRIKIDFCELTAAQWARERGFPPYLIHGRLHKGWSERDAVLRPLKRRVAVKS